MEKIFSPQRHKDTNIGRRLAANLRRIYERPQPAVPWRDGGNLPWDDPEFSRRMLAQHLDQSHGAASRPLTEIRAQVEKMVKWLDLAPGKRLLDVTCGPGLYAAEFARRGIQVTGIDFGPAAIEYARKLCADLPCEFVFGDVRQMDFAGRAFDAAIYLYGQFTVLRPEESADVLRRIREALKPGAKLLLEILDDDRFDKKDSTWWYTDRGGLWGDFPYLHLGERTWDPIQRAAVERFFIINLETGEMQTYGLADQAYTVAQMTEMLQQAGFDQVQTYPAWDGLALKDAAEWMVYVAVCGE
ncbi:MAG: methyltransferase domain-containing protein [Anaerolineae bacterium]